MWRGARRGKRIHLQSTDSFSRAKNPQKLQIPITPYPQGGNDYIIQMAYRLFRGKNIHLLNDDSGARTAKHQHLCYPICLTARYNQLRTTFNVCASLNSCSRGGEKDPPTLHLFYQHPSSFWSEKPAAAWSKTTLCSLDGEIQERSSRTLRIFSTR